MPKVIGSHRPRQMSRAVATDVPSDIAEVVRRALREDVGAGDVTAGLIPSSLWRRGMVVSRETAILCGTAWFDRVFAELDPSVCITWHAADGARLSPDEHVCTVEGPARALLTGERTALNFLQCLSGTATTARDYAEAVRGTAATILDTRKTLPGLRTAQKYAVRCGGCRNHRMGLFDAVLIKENHILAVGSIQSAVKRSHETHPGLPVEVEVENLRELEEALASAADIIMLDNFDLHMVRQAARMSAGRAKLEVSGGLDLDSVRALAQSGADYISVGSLTKHVRAVDFSMRFEPL